MHAAVARFVLAFTLVIAVTVCACSRKTDDRQKAVEQAGDWPPAPGPLSADRDDANLFPPGGVPRASAESGTAAPQAPDTPQRVTNSIGMQLVRIPAGQFMMGARGDDEDGRDDEKPRHRVRITRPFYMGRHEVTQQQFQRVTGTKRSFFSASGPGKDRVQGLKTADFPVEQVNWHEAVSFCRALSAMPAEVAAGRVYRLPTEAEWEYACRAGSETTFHYGDSLSAAQANFNGNYPHGDGPSGPFLARTTRVGSYEANAFGLYDMHGNVWEWCLDWYAADYYQHAPAEDPTGPDQGTSHVIRGGGWYSDARDCRSSFRNAEIPNGVFYVMGFRVVMTRSDARIDRSVAAPSTSAPQDSQPSTASLPASELAAEDTLQEGESWPRWRGPRGDGTWNGPELAQQWPAAGVPRLWQQPLGGGYAGLAAAEGRVYTMDFQQKPQPTERLLCFHAATGKLLWAHAEPVSYEGLEYGSGPRATPTVFEGRVYALGAVGDLHCLDAATGRPHWTINMVQQYQAPLPIWGFAASPLVYHNLLIVHVGAEPDGCLIALDRLSGKEVWRALPDSAGYATPILIERHGARQLVCWTPANVCGLNPDRGEVLWKIPFEVTYGTAIATPIFQENIVLVSGYWEGSKAIRLGNEPAEAEVIWEDRRNLRGLMCQPLYRDGYVYLLDKRHGLTCFELQTGRKVWDDANRMTPKGRNPQATMVWLGDGDRVIVLNSEGELILARFNPAGYHEQSRVKIISGTWAHPAYAGNRIFARSDSELVSCLLTAPHKPSGKSPPR